MQHILVARGKPGSPSFMRSDRFGRQWIRHEFDGQTLRAIIPTIVRDLEVSNGAIGVTLSTCRDGSAFNDPDAASIPYGVNVVTLCPIEMPLPGDIASMRLWTVVNWSGPDSPPSLGEKVRQKMLGAWLGEFFTTEQFESWGKPSGGLKLEIWLRPNWIAREMFPELFVSKASVEAPKPTGEEPVAQKKNRKK